MHNEKSGLLTGGRMTGADTLGCLKSKIRCGWDQEDTDQLEVWIWLLCEDNMLKKSCCETQAASIQQGDSQPSDYTGSTWSAGRKGLELLEKPEREPYWLTPEGCQLSQWVNSSTCLSFARPPWLSPPPPPPRTPWTL